MNWESLIGAKIEAHRDTHTVCKIEDARKRNSRRAQLKWKHERATSAPGHFSTIRQYEKALNVPAEHLFPDIFNS